MMDSQIDKNAVQKSFDSAADVYDSYAGLQQVVACALLEVCKKYIAFPDNALDIGSGTGYGARLLCRHFPAVRAVALDFSPKMLQRSLSHNQYLDRIHYVCADADDPPFTHHAFDVIYSSSFIQWCSNSEYLFTRCYEMLKADGWLFFSTFGPKTLFEIRESWQAVDSDSHTLIFEDAKDLMQKLKHVGFVVESCRRSIRVIQHTGVDAALRSLKDIGAQNHLKTRAGGLTPPRKLNMMREVYKERFAVQGFVPTTYELLLFAAHRS